MQDKNKPTAQSFRDAMVSSGVTPELDPMDIHTPKEPQGANEEPIIAPEEQQTPPISASALQEMVALRATAAVIATEMARVEEENNTTLDAVEAVYGPVHLDLAEGNVECEDECVALNGAPIVRGLISGLLKAENSDWCNEACTDDEDDEEYEPRGPGRWAQACAVTF